MSNIYKHVLESIIVDPTQDVSIKMHHKKITADSNMLGFYVHQIIDNNTSVEDTKDYYNLILETKKKIDKKYIVNDYQELKDIITTLTEFVTVEPDLNWIDIKNVNSLKYLFSPHYDSNMKFEYDVNQKLKFFNGDISEWNTEYVTDMSYMFRGCESFDQPLNFNTKNVRDMSYMFYGCESFDQQLNFDTTSLVRAKKMFYNCSISDQHKIDVDE